MHAVTTDLLYTLSQQGLWAGDSRARLEEAILLALAARDYESARTLLLALELLKPRRRFGVAAALEAVGMGLPFREALEVALQEARRYLGGRSYRRFASRRFRKPLEAYLQGLEGRVAAEQLAKSRKSLSKLTTAEIHMAERVLLRAQRRWKSPETVYQAFDAFLVAVQLAHRPARA